MGFHLHKPNQHQRISSKSLMFLQLGSSHRSYPVLLDLAAAEIGTTYRLESSDWQKVVRTSVSRTRTSWVGGGLSTGLSNFNSAQIDELN